MTVFPAVLPANGWRFRALSTGPADGPVVLLLHGFPQTAASWRAVMDRLAERGLRCVAADQRGYSPGARPAAVEHYRLSLLVADAVGLVEALGAPVHLVGHDWGGVVGWQVAARHPALLASWTAVSTAHPLALDEVMAGDGADPAAERARFGYIRGLRSPTAEQALLAGGAQRLRAVFEGRVPAERVEEDVSALSEPGALTGALNWYRAMAREDNAGLADVTVPTTYVWGSQDIAFSPAAAHASAKYVAADYRFVPLDGASHWLPDEVPDVLAAQIARRVSGGTDGD